MTQKMVMNKMSNRLYQYFVEGECEKKMIDTFKSHPYSFFRAGKVEVLNVVFHKLTDARLRLLNPKTTSIFLEYDTDIEKTDILAFIIQRDE